jgi:polyhydroxyalkanoate synthesis regulator phasin
MTTIPRAFRRALLAGGAVLVLGGAAVGIAAAQTAPTTTTGQQQGQSNYAKFIASLASKLGIQPADLESKISQARTDAGFPAGNGLPGRGGPGGQRGGFGAESGVVTSLLKIDAQTLRTELQTKSLAQVASEHGSNGAAVATALKDDAHKRIDAAVTAGRLTTDQANQQKTQADQRIDQMVNQVMPQGGPGGPGGRGGFGADSTVVTSLLKIDAQTLRTQLQTKSLAQVASEHGSNGAAVATALKDAAHKRIDAAVTAGKLTADQATQQKTQADQRIDQSINQVMPQRGAGRGADAEDPNA